MSTDVDPLLRPARSRCWRVLRWGALAVVVFSIGIGAVFGARLGTDPTLVDSPLIGQPAPTRTVPYLEQPGTMSLADLRGQVIVVNFWASWCAQCRTEHPALLAAARDYPSAGITFVGVNYQDGHHSAIGFLDELGRGGPNYRYITDPSSRLALDFGVFGVPETFVIDRQGKIVAKITGTSNYPLLARVLDTVLAGRQPRPDIAGPTQPTPGN